VQVIPFQKPQSTKTLTKTGFEQNRTLQHACGKAILVGEHAVVYGAKAIAMPLPFQRIQVSLDLLESTQNDRCQVFLNDEELSPEATVVVHDAFQLFGLKPRAVTLRGDSNLLIGAGLGSSASLCIVTLRAIAGAFGIEIDRATLARFGTQLERRFHGNPSGMDTAVVAYEQVVSFRKGETPMPVSVRSIDDLHKWRFALIDSNERASTKKMIERAAPYFQSANGGEIVTAFDRMADDVITGLSEGRLEPVASAMRDAYSHLREAGVSTPKLDEIISESLSIGCLAAKPTGSGGGGTAIALLDPINYQAQLSELSQTFGINNVHEAFLPCNG
jgi:mevalonate kinase